MLKVHIEGFRGEWGWLNEFERQTKFQIVSSEDADVIFQCDPENWAFNAKYLGTKCVIANVLDFAEWVGGNPNIDSYVENFCRKATVVTGISHTVINQLKEKNIEAQMFYYPSQVDNKIICMTNGMLKTNSKRVISFCRLHDKGKRVEEAIAAFLNSELPDKGWIYFLTGPTKPSFVPNHPAIHYTGFLKKEILYRTVADAQMTVSPEVGSGLGLPSIESLLVDTPVISRSIQPIKGIVGNQAHYFETFNDLILLFNRLGNGELVEHVNKSARVENWNKDVAFVLLEQLIEKVYYNKK